VEGRVGDARRVAGGIDALQLASSAAIARVSPRAAARLAYEIAPGAGPMRAALWRAPQDVAIKGDLAAEMPGASHSANDAIPLDAGWPRPVELGRGSARVLLARLEPADEPIMPLAAPRPDAFGVIGGELDQPGMIIVALPGQAVVAPTAGRVVFAGPFRSYGLLLIIEQEREYHTLLWGFSRLDVVAGDTVRAGQIVGTMAADGNPDAKLHVELRRNGQPVSPSLWLAGSSSKVRG
ncbi:MAG: murein hydrolase activator EnvC family protein, partial [Geminicoccaceae bacterium]